MRSDRARRNVFLPRIPIRVAVLAGLLLFAIACSSRPPTVEENLQVSTSELQEMAWDVVKDPQRARKVVELMDQIEQQVAGLIKIREGYLERLRILDENYDATEAEFRALMAEFSAVCEKRQEHLFELRDWMMAATTAEEWDQLTRMRLAALEPLVIPR